PSTVSAVNGPFGPAAATPANGSAAIAVTVTGWLTQPVPGPVMRIVGALASTRIGTLVGAEATPLPDTAATLRELTPSGRRPSWNWCSVRPPGTASSASAQRVGLAQGASPARPLTDTA